MARQLLAVVLVLAGCQDKPLPSCAVNEAELSAARWSMRACEKQRELHQLRKAAGKPNDGQEPDCILEAKRVTAALKALEEPCRR